MQNDSNGFALEFRLRELDVDLHRRFADCIFALQMILSNYKLLFPEYTDHSEIPGALRQMRISDLMKPV